MQNPLHWSDLIHMLTTIAVIASGIVYIGDIEEEVARQGERILGVEKRMEDERERRDGQYQEIRQMIQGVDHKLDRLIERVLDGK